MRTSIDERGDPFTDPGMWLILLALALLVLLAVGEIVAVYYGDEVVRPSWNEHSMPQPRGSDRQSGTSLHHPLAILAVGGPGRAE
jgi:hypothetical protein